MPSQKSFGKRANSQPTTTRAPSVAVRIVPPVKEASVRGVEADPAPNSMPPVSDIGSVDVDRELEEWKAMRKLQRRSFREPWRTLTIAATIGFGVSSWLLPDSVSDIAQLVTGGLGAASFFAGFRIAPVQKPSSGFDS